MGYDQWARILVKSKSLDLMIHNVDLKYGKFYGATRDVELPISSVEGKIIPKNNGGFLIATCGREDSPSGTEGSFDVYDGNVLVGHYYWDCPYGSKVNTSRWTPASEDYTGGANGGQINGGPLKDITITIGRA